MSAVCPRHSGYLYGNDACTRPICGAVSYNPAGQGEADYRPRPLGFIELSEGTIRKDVHPFGLFWVSQPPTSFLRAVRGA